MSVKKEPDNGFGASVPPGAMGSMTDTPLALVAQLLRHKGKLIAFNAGRHRVRGRVINVDTKYFIVDIEVESGPEPGIHMMRIGRMDKIAFLRE